MAKRKSYRKRLWRNRRRTCYYCGKKLVKHEITADHVKPLGAGGYDKLKNVVTACVTCNGIKGMMSREDFINSPRFTDPDSALNRLRRDRPSLFDFAAAHAPSSPTVGDR